MNTLALTSSTSSAVSTITGSSSVPSVVTASKNVTRSLTSGKDDLGISVTSIISVVQGTTTYTEGTDFSLSNNNQTIAWGVDSNGNALSNAKIPNGANVYTVKYTQSSSIALGTYSASISNNADDSTYISLSLKSTKVVAGNQSQVEEDIASFISIVMNKLQEVNSTVPEAPASVSVTSSGVVTAS